MADSNKKLNRNYFNRLQVTDSKPLKWFLITLGTISVGLGFLGIFVPLLPTTAFLLLAAWAYARSSNRFYNWLLNNRIFGRYITSYLEGKGVPLQTKIWSILLLWITILSSVILFIDNIYINILLILIAIGVTIHIVTLPNFRKNHKVLIKNSPSFERSKN
jgi:uncharacterized membrane protein YbaN (DUF454 family)